jgi:hypothetical protein
MGRSSHRDSHVVSLSLRRVVRRGEYVMLAGTLISDSATGER